MYASMGKKVRYVTTNRELIIFNHNDSDNSINVVGHDFDLMHNINIVHKGDDVLLVEFDGGPCIYAPAIWGVGDEKESSTLLSKIHPDFGRMYVKKIVVNDITGAVKLLVEKDPTDIDVKLKWELHEDN